MWWEFFDSTDQFLLQACYLRQQIFNDLFPYNGKVTLPLNRLPSPNISRTQSLPKVATDADPSTSNDDVSLNLTDKALVGGAVTVAGVAGLTRGAYKAAVKDIPAQTREGAKLGSRGGRLIGRILGGAASAVATAVAAVAAPVTTVLGAAGGFVGGTLAGAGRLVAPAVRAGVQIGVRAGAVAGSWGLGLVGGAAGAVAGLCTLPSLLYPPLGLRVVPLAVRGGAMGGFRGGMIAGRYLGMGVGAACGAVGGAVASVLGGVPVGLRAGYAGGRLGARTFGLLPRFARGAWKAAVAGGGAIGHYAGGATGAAVGVTTGGVTTVAKGLAEGAQTGVRWGGHMAEDRIRIKQEKADQLKSVAEESVVDKGE